MTWADFQVWVDALNPRPEEEVRFEHFKGDDQTEQEVAGAGRLTDEDGKPYIWISIRNK